MSSAIGGFSGALSGIAAAQVYLGHAPDPGTVIAWTIDPGPVAERLSATLREADEFQAAGVVVAPTMRAYFADVIGPPAWERQVVSPIQAALDLYGLGYTELADEITEGWRHRVSDDGLTQDPKKWGLTAAEFARRAAERRASLKSGQSARDHLATGALSEQKTGRITWRPGAVDFDLIRPSDVQRSLFRLEKALPELDWNAAALEGNAFTLPQVLTLLDGVTVGGKKLEEAEQILALSEAMGLKIGVVRDGTFSLSNEMSDRIHGVLAKHEAIESGSFRGEGSVLGGGSVRRAGGGAVEGDPVGAGGERLQADYTNLLAGIGTLGDARAPALVYFASATRSQFYFDGNKRTARIMMNSALIAAGFEPVSVPFARQEEFNIALDDHFRTDDGTKLIAFLTTCTMLDLT